MTSSKRFFIVGGAGFIGSHFTDRLLGDEQTEQVTLFDNFTSGREWHFQAHTGDTRFRVVRGDVKDLPLLAESMANHDAVIHLASNPDIARAATEPDIDFREGTYLTNNVVEAMRLSRVPKILYASGSGIYGDLGELEAAEDHGPLIPVSTYGASKLAGEALISSYCHMFEITGRAFRFGNVVGPRQTHGVGFDFLRHLLKTPGKLRILGDGTQSKSYVHVSDVVNAVLLASEVASAGRDPAPPNERGTSAGLGADRESVALPRFSEAPSRFAAYNVATGDYITVTEIAQLALEILELNPATVRFEYTGGSRGWKGDVPVVRLNTDRIRSLGWQCGSSTREALRKSMLAMIPDMRAGLL